MPLSSCDRQNSEVKKPKRDQEKLETLIKFIFMNSFLGMDRSTLNYSNEFT